MTDRGLELPDADAGAADQPARHIVRTSPVTPLSVVGCSGHPVLKRVLKRLAGPAYVASVRDEHGRRHKLAGHLRYCAENLALFEAHDVRAVLIYRDPRDNLKHLVDRSIHGYCPDKFERPGTHADAVRYHQLVKAAQGTRGGESYVEFYVETIGAEQVLRDIFQVTMWKDHPRVHPVAFEPQDSARRHDSSTRAGSISIPYASYPRRSAMIVMMPRPEPSSRNARPRGRR